MLRGVLIQTIRAAVVTSALWLVGCASASDPAKLDELFSRA